MDSSGYIKGVRSWNRITVMLEGLLLYLYLRSDTGNPMFWVISGKKRRPGPKKVLL